MDQEGMLLHSITQFEVQHGQIRAIPCQSSIYSLDSTEELDRKFSYKSPQDIAAAAAATIHGPTSSQGEPAVIVAYSNCLIDTCLLIRFCNQL